MRYKWLAANWSGLNPRSLARRLRTREFSDDTADGFVVDRVRDEFLDARYVERLEYDEVTVDPFGRENTLHRVEYRQTEFRAFCGQPGLELRAPARGNQGLLSRLSEATDFRISVSGFSVDVLQWAAILQRSRPGTFHIASVQIADVELAEGISATVTVKGGEEVLPSTEKLLLGRRHVVDRLLLVSSAREPLRVLLTRGGSAKVDGDADDPLLTVMRQALSDVGTAS